MGIGRTKATWTAGNGAGGVTRTPFGGEVVPLCAQFSAQHSFASATSGVISWSIAFLQQSMSIMLLMSQSFPPNVSGTPANAPPKSTSKRTRDASRFFIRGSLYCNSELPSTFQPPVWAESGHGHSHSARCVPSDFYRPFSINDG